MDAGGGGASAHGLAVVTIRKLDPQHEPAFGPAHARAGGEVPQHFLTRGLDRVPELGPQSPHVAVCRVEQLYPLPVRDLLGVIEGYPALEEVVWVQEEPENMGAWEFVRSSLEGLAASRRLSVLARPRSSSPAEGSAARHAKNQEELLRTALAGTPAAVRP